MEPAAADFYWFTVPYNVRHKVAARMEAAVGGQLTDWNFELRGAQSWITDEARWDYQDVKVSIPGGQYHFNLNKT